MFGFFTPTKSESGSEGQVNEKLEESESAIEQSEAVTEVKDKAEDVSEKVPEVDAAKDVAEGEATLAEKSKVETANVETAITTSTREFVVQAKEHVPAVEEVEDLALKPSLLTLILTCCGRPLPSATKKVDDSSSTGASSAS
eukprot:TRINITY_DN871_c0_g1_i3.p1 TRINITY_DN871_c0_g1~~TRINITY_DN871_c0_g1_i3.p1  ORF type:complete len:142 (-),score=32.92 TRINITY_DN871_c0_g1_i3:459-884(-)